MFVLFIAETMLTLTSGTEAFLTGLKQRLGYTFVLLVILYEAVSMSRHQNPVQPTYSKKAEPGSEELPSTISLQGKILNLALFTELQERDAKTLNELKTGDKHSVIARKIRGASDYARGNRHKPKRDRLIKRGLSFVDYFQL